MIIDKQKDEVLKIKKKLPKMPLWAMELWVRNSIREGNNGDLNDLLMRPYAGPSDGGFDWVNSLQGGNFWSCMCGDTPIHYFGMSISRVHAEVSDYLDFQHFS